MVGEGNPLIPEILGQIDLLFETRQLPIDICSYRFSRKLIGSPLRAL